MVTIDGRISEDAALAWRLPASTFSNDVFGTAPIDAGAWLRIVAVAVVISCVNAVDKRVRRGRV